MFEFQYFNVLFYFCPLEVTSVAPQIDLVTAVLILFASATHI